MSAKKKSNYKPTITYSVGKYRFLYFNGIRMSFGRLKDLGITSEKIAKYKSKVGAFSMPTGLFGGPIDKDKKEEVLEFAYGLFSYCGVAYDPEDFEILIRYHVMSGDRITVDAPPTQAANGQLDYTLNKGYKKLATAEAAAESFFKYYSNWLKGDEGKMIQKVQLILKDEQGNVTLKKSTT